MAPSRAESACQRPCKSASLGRSGLPSRAQAASVCALCRPGPPLTEFAGILPYQAIEALIDQGAVRTQAPWAADQLQPASLDLRLGASAWRVRASFLPGAGRSVAERMADVAMHRLDLTGGAVLERGCVYIAELQERLDLPAQVAARANPKSSTGRVDVFVRLLTDSGEAFDDVAEGYSGPLYLEIAPQTFSVLVRTGTRLNQLRLKRGRAAALSVRSVGVDLTPGLAGFRARRHAGVVDLDREDGHAPRDFWEPLEARPNRHGVGELLLNVEILFDSLFLMPRL